MILLVIAFFIFLVVIGTLMIFKGSNSMTDSLTAVAHKLGTSSVAIASIVVSLMLTLPNIFIALYSFFKGHVGISVGLIIGSVICNTCLTTGISAVLKPLSVPKRVIVRDGIFYMTILVILFVSAGNGSIDRSEGVTFLLLLVPYLLSVWFFESSRKHEIKPDKEPATELEVKLKPYYNITHPKPGFFLLFLGISVMLIGSYIFSEALLGLAKLSGISDIIIGLTFGAIAPTIPNIISGIQGTRKGYTSIAIVETFSSNILTVLVTFGLLAMLAPVSILPKWSLFDIPAMIATSGLLMFFILKSKLVHEKAVLRYEGIILILSYLIFILISVFLFR